MCLCTPEKRTPICSNCYKAEQENNIVCTCNNNCESCAKCVSDIVNKVGEEDVS